jgi:pimeloyl-ACP methyl ester carboxylesterase
MAAGLLHVERVGAGPLVLLLHGSMGHGSAAFETLRPLHDRYELAFIDRRGFGQSPPRLRGVDFDPDADDLVELLGDGAHLIGHSYGGLVALLAASRQPSRVRSLTVVEPPAFALAPNDPAIRRVRERMASVFPAPDGITPGRWLATFEEALGSPSSPELPVSPAEEPDIRASMRERPPWEAALDPEPIRVAGVPTLVLAGDWASDPGAKAIAGAALRVAAERVAIMTGGRLLVVPGAAHQPQLEQPGLVVPVIADHLAAAEDRRGRRSGPQPGPAGDQPGPTGR